jgi:hypothetical protein
VGVAIALLILIPASFSASTYGPIEPGSFYFVQPAITLNSTTSPTQYASASSTAPPSENVAVQPFSEYSAASAQTITNAGSLGFAGLLAAIGVIVGASFAFVARRRFNREDWTRSYDGDQLVNQVEKK